MPPQSPPLTMPSLQTPQTLRAALTSCTALLADCGVDSPRLSAEVLVAATLQMERNELLKVLIITPEHPLSSEECCRIEEFTARRANGEPVAYIVGHKEFYGRDFRVTPATLVPRPETELLVELAAQAAQDISTCTQPSPETIHPVFTDLGTGSGCIAVTLALALPGWQGIAVDISSTALAVAKHNAETHGAKNLRFVRADFTQPLLAPLSLHLLVSNPPYISEEEYTDLDHEVRSFEPKSALVPVLPPSCRGKAHGLEHAYSIIEEAERVLCPGGWLFMEIGFQQGPALLTSLAPEHWRNCRIHTDLAGLDRVLAAQKTT